MINSQLFSEINLPHPLALGLKKMEFITPTPVQAATIQPALNGKDILGTAGTGTGKTGAFGVPLLATVYPDPRKQALVLAPTRELAAQILKVLRRMSCETSLNGALVVGGESFQRQVAEIRKGADYVVATPGRLNDHLEQRTINLSRVCLLVIDEVDRMMDMGFAPQIRRILQHVPKKRQTLVFSATLPPKVTPLVQTLVTDPVRVHIGSTEHPVVLDKQEVIETSEQGKTQVILKEIKAREGRILIFARTKSRTERLARTLGQNRINTVTMHGGRSNGQRKDALRKFISGSHRIMVATDLAGRGIDVTDIQHIINYDLPQSREDYIHRVGRTARFGKTGSALTLVTSIDLDSEFIVSGKKKPARIVYRTRRWR
ncbi:MAG: DEAD/DEAH box helicase [Deltaproteobacteria bacterium]|nr:DEAD/DEAH box helicase [Deltaproteobacteria bacterium]